MSASNTLCTLPTRDLYIPMHALETYLHNQGNKEAEKRIQMHYHRETTFIVDRVPVPVNAKCHLVMLMVVHSSLFQLVSLRPFIYTTFAKYIHNCNTIPTGQPGRWACCGFEISFYGPFSFSIGPFHHQILIADVLCISCSRNENAMNCYFLILFLLLQQQNSSPDVLTKRWLWCWGGSYIGRHRLSLLHYWWVQWEADTLVWLEKGLKFCQKRVQFKLK